LLTIRRSFPESLSLGLLQLTDWCGEKGQKNHAGRKSVRGVAVIERGKATQNTVYLYLHMAILAVRYRTHPTSERRFVCDTHHSVVHQESTEVPADRAAPGATGSLTGGMAGSSSRLLAGCHATNVALNRFDTRI